MFSWRRFFCSSISRWMDSICSTSNDSKVVILTATVYPVILCTAFLTFPNPPSPITSSEYLQAYSAHSLQGLTFVVWYGCGRTASLAESPRVILIGSLQDLQNRSLTFILCNKRRVFDLSNNQTDQNNKFNALTFHIWCSLNHRLHFKDKYFKNFIFLYWLSSS